ncbi:hypothetical protein ACFJIX_23325 [Roseateles sp. UC29_93]|uniref:hypothetical protein n=1 Tax=Roseateles sp. UC29_93 TaxID=3350177 RepID=UPI00366D9822
MLRPFLRVLGSLRIDGTYRPLPGWETTRLTKRCRPAADLGLRLLDDMGTAVAKGNLERRTSLCGSCEVRSADTARITGHVALHPNATALELICEGQVIHKAPIARERPKIHSLKVTPGDESWLVQWEVEHPMPLTYNLVFLDPQRRAIPVARSLNESSFEIDLRGLPGGSECRIGLLATDGIRSETAQSDAWSVPTRPAILCFHAPSSQAVLLPYQPFTLQGSAYDPAGRALPDDGIVWSIDGAVVARGVRLATSAPLTSGEHEVEMGYLSHSGDEKVSLKRTVVVPPNTPEMEHWVRVRASLFS